MKKVELRMKELNKYQIIKELVDHNGNKNNAALKLGITKRQVNRLIKIYKEKGKQGFVHGNRSKKPVITLSSDLSNDIITLYANKYQGFNFTHFLEYLKNDENINISYSALYNLLTKNGFYSPRIRRKTKKDLTKLRLEKENKLKNKTEEEISVIVSNEIALEDSHPRQEKPKYFGEITEMDGSIHLWFGDKKCCLHLAADKATNRVVGGYFDWQETLYGYYTVFQQILVNYGIPSKFKTDNRTVFNYELINPSKRTSDKDVLTQFGYACKQLGTSIETSSVAQSKGMIERHNGTFQDRLVNELKLNNITCIEQANEYLINVFIPKFNNTFTLDYSKFESVYEESPSAEKINYTLAVLTKRKIDNGNSIKFKNNYYQPFNSKSMVYFRPKTECLVIEAFNGALLVNINESIYVLKKLNKHQEFSEEFDIAPNCEASKEQSQEEKIPEMIYHWKKEVFEEQVEKAHTKKIYA